MHLTSLQYYCVCVFYSWSPCWPVSSIPKCTHMTFAFCSLTTSVLPGVLPSSPNIEENFSFPCWKIPLSFTLLLSPFLFFSYLFSPLLFISFLFSSFLFFSFLFSSLFFFPLAPLVFSFFFFLFSSFLFFVHHYLSFWVIVSSLHIYFRCVLFSLIFSYPFHALWYLFSLYLSIFLILILDFPIQIYLCIFVCIYLCICLSIYLSIYLYNFTSLSPSFLVLLFSYVFPLGTTLWTVNELVGALIEIYCGNVGAEYLHIENEQQRNWLKNKIEGKPLLNVLNLFIYYHLFNNLLSFI